MTAYLYVGLWLLASGVAGYFLGASSRTSKERQAAEKQRQVALRVMSSVLDATEQLSSNVLSYNTEIRGVEQSLGDMHTDGELQRMQQALLKQITHVLSSNRKLEDDLQCTRVQVEKQAEEIDKARREARTDALSGTGNRAAFEEQLVYFLAMWRRQHRSFALVLLDIDHFKWINDSHGHQAGDRVVERLGALLKSCLREDDFVGRYGGDEFALLLAGVEEQTALHIAERIRGLASGSNLDVGRGNDKVAVTLSIGVAMVRPDATAEAILHHADQALYLSKSRGRNQVHTFDDAAAATAVAAGTTSA